MRTVDVVVLGAGAMGASAAWWLARRGRHVVVCEQFEQGHGRGSSHGSTRIFRLAYPEPDYVELARQSLPLWRELEDDAGVLLLDTTGGVDHGDPRSLDALAAALEAARAPYEGFGLEDAQERWPGMRFSGPVLFQPDAGRVYADATVRALQDAAARHGADVRFATPATIEAADRDHAVVRAGDEELEARAVVVACGGWTGAVVGSRLPGLPGLEVTREQVFHFPTADPSTPWPSFIHHRSPAVYGLLAPGEGVKVAEHHAGAVTTTDERTFDVDEVGRERLCRYVESWLPGLDAVPSSATTCLYTNTESEDFVVDRVGSIVVGAGFSGHGFKFTPLIGRLLADLVDGTPLPPAARRFALEP